jgi:hypothetical protein
VAFLENTIFTLCYPEYSSTYNITFFKYQVDMFNAVGATRMKNKDIKMVLQNFFDPIAH